MRSGNVDMPNGSLRIAGHYGYAVSRTAVAYGVGVWDATIYALEFNVSGLYPSRGPNVRWIGYPVRCLASDV